MKRVVWISGFISITLLSLLLTGFADIDDATKKALTQGNAQYEAGVYNEALTQYETGLSLNPENKDLNFNAAQAAYALGEYEKAIAYYEKAEAGTDKFLNSGNAASRLGDSAPDEEKADYYMYALQAYLDGIVEYPEDLQLKYNFETMKKKIEELMNNSEQEQENEEQSDSEESEENEEQSDSGENGEQNQDQNQEQNQNQESEESETEESESTSEDNSEENEEQQDESAESDSGDDEQDASESEESEASEANESGEEEPDWEAIERILQMLESQEESSLKNNREVIEGGNEKNGW